MSKRHLIVMEFYVNGYSDAEAVERAEEIAEEQRRYLDNQCTVTAVYDAPYAGKTKLIKGTETEKV